MSAKNKSGADDTKSGCWEKEGSKSCPLNISHPLRYYEFTQEELKALEECDRESFYQRCLPYSTVLATVTYAAMKYGVLKRNRYFGVVPKMALAVLLGHVYGRISYQPECELKLRELPAKSHLGNTMRRYKEERDPKPKK